MELSALVAVAVASAALSMVPGPDMMFVIANGLAHGRVAGMVAAVGMSTGLAVHTVAAAFGAGALFAAMPPLLDIVRLAGAALLGYLMVVALRSARTPVVLAKPPLDTRPLAYRRTYATAVLTDLGNPKVVIFFVSFFPQFLTAGGWPAPVQLLILGAVFIAVGLAVDASVGLAAGSLAEVFRRRPGIQLWLNRVSAAIFGALALRLIVDVLPDPLGTEVLRLAIGAMER